MNTIEGRPIAESRRIALEGLARWDRIAALWDELTDEEQKQIEDQVKTLASRNEA